MAERLKRKLRMGMIGGGEGAFIGAVHRMAANLDGMIELVAGAFSSDPDNSTRTGETLFLDPTRVYPTFQNMIEEESSLPSSKRIDFVSIVTPNYLHFEPAVLALRQGIAVVIDKPLCISMDQASELQEVVRDSNLPCAVTYTYTGYPMIKQARAMVQAGVLGNLRKILVEYPQGWLATRLETEGQKQAAWKTDPKKAGRSGCFGDIGVHAANLAEFVTALPITEILAETRTFVEGRALEDDVSVLLRFENGATGSIYATQIAAGEENDINIRVYGERGRLAWSHFQPNSLEFTPRNQPKQIYRSGCDNTYLHPSALKYCRTPSGHPEGYIEAFANIYRSFAQSLGNNLFGTEYVNRLNDFPGIEEGYRGMAFIEAVHASSNPGSHWQNIGL